MDQVIEITRIHDLMPRAEAEAKAVDLFRALSLPSPETIGGRYPHQVSGGQLQRLSAAMYGSPERAKVVDFSQDVYAYGEGLVVKSDDAKDYVGFEDLKGKKVGGQIGTRYIDALKASGAPAEVNAYDSLPDILRDVSNGRLDAGIGDYPILAYNLAQGRFPQLRLVKSYKPSVPGPINIAVKQGNAELLAKINTSLANMKKDGRFDTILKKWGL